VLDWNRLTPAVERAASIAATKFPEHHDISDVKQTLWVWVMENKPTVLRILSDPDSTPAAIVPLLVRAASEHLKAEDAAVYGYAEEDKFYYSTDLIKSILEVVFNYEDWQSFAQSQDTQPKAKANPALGGNNLASYADVSRAVDQLPEDQYNAIVWRYKYGYTHQQIGGAMDFSRQRARKVLDGAYAAIQKHLGEQSLSELRRGHSERTEARSSVSGQVQVERDYEG